MNQVQRRNDDYAVQGTVYDSGMSTASVHTGSDGGDESSDAAVTVFHGHVMHNTVRPGGKIRKAERRPSVEEKRDRQLQRLYDARKPPPVNVNDSLGAHKVDARTNSLLD